MPLLLAGTRDTVCSSLGRRAEKYSCWVLSSSQDSPPALAQTRSVFNISEKNLAVGDLDHLASSLALDAHAVVLAGSNLCGRVSTVMAAMKDILWSVRTLLGYRGCHSRCGHRGDGGDDGGKLHIAWIMCRKKRSRVERQVDFEVAQRE